MRCRNDVTLLGHLSEDLEALRKRLLGVAVEMDDDRRIGKLHRANMDQVNPDNQLLPLAFDGIDDVPGGVPIGGRCLDASAEIRVSVKRLELSSLDVGI